MNKKFFGFALVLTLAAALGACGETSDTPDATTTTPAGGASPAATTPATSPSPAATTSPAKPPAKTP